ncbi:hypothetical protein NQ315_015423 [Exocentrus adspersus]|uniref:Fatty acid desaturase domain-containing protein n=1 Tax=Exocentrus adspersus TaxID=1586481 RepID=A0AAV8VN06_9CUCU|nr:hypothetical protein NQ315_015423 [Exocentrus adspersus]
MAPNLLGSSTLLANTAEPVQIISRPVAYGTYHTQTSLGKGGQFSASRYRSKIVWRNVFVFLFLHIAAIYGLSLLFTQAKWKTSLFVYIYCVFTGLGTTAGAHRLWAHRTYKAKLPLRILLMIMQTTALQNHIYEWVRDHRVHHKFTDTDADPHNAKRGRTLDLSDLEADSVVMFQKKYYLILAPLFCFLIPPLFPWYFWSEPWWTSFYTVGVFRYTLTLNGTWLVNSAAHIFGTKPYDKTIKPTENRFVAWIAFGEGWHNYHHVFPWDYKAAELGNYRLNFTTAFLDFMAKVGWAYDLKTVSPHMVKKRVQRTGDGTWEEVKNGKMNGDDNDHQFHSDALWGWGDKDMKDEDICHIKKYNNLS